MPESIPKLRAVGEGERPARRGRGPGLAVILIGLYALAFGAALWVIKSRAFAPPTAKTADAGNSARPAGSRGKLDRQELFSGAGLDPEPRAEYLQRLSIDCCDCGCDLTLSRCLVGDQKCARSAQMAEERQAPPE
jgi:hypothetical protein